MLSTIVSLFSIFLYTAMGAYVLKKNPHERTNKIFSLLMLVFIVWSVWTYNTGLIARNAQIADIVLNMKIQVSGLIIALTFLSVFAYSRIKKERKVYLIFIFSFYILYLIWTSGISDFEMGMFSTMAGSIKELFLFSAVFGVTGIYLLLKYYSTSKYKQKEQATFMLAGAMSAVVIAVMADIILPMFFEIYSLELITLAPAVMAIFFSYSIYHYGMFIKPVPEISPTSFCGIECTLCPEYMNDTCKGCRFDRKRYSECIVYSCLIKKGFRDCGDCSEMIDCAIREKSPCYVYQRNFRTMSACRYDLKHGHVYIIKGKGYQVFRDAINCGSFGLLATSGDPGEIKEDYSLLTTPVIRISRDDVEMGVYPEDLKRLSGLLINFMNKIDNTVILLDGMDMLIKVNGFEKMHGVLQVINSAVKATNSLLFISTDLEGPDLDKLKNGYEYFENL